jgi:hypothetical protein
MFIASFYCSTFVYSVLCSIQCILFDYSVINYSVFFLFLYLNWIPGISIPLLNTTTNRQSINIIQQTGQRHLCRSIGSKRPTYYSHRHRGISGTNFSIRVKQMARQLSPQNFSHESSRTFINNHNRWFFDSVESIAGFLMVMNYQLI